MSFPQQQQLAQAPVPLCQPLGDQLRPMPAHFFYDPTVSTMGDGGNQLPGMSNVMKNIMKGMC